MDGADEKKWFVYLNDHHEGPFSLAEIRSKMDTSEINNEHYVWAEGLTDWKPMTEVPEFEVVLAPATSAKSHTHSVIKTVSTARAAGGTGAVVVAKEPSRPDIQLVQVPEEVKKAKPDDGIQDPRKLEPVTLDIPPESSGAPTTLLSSPAPVSAKEKGTGQTLSKTVMTQQTGATKTVTKSVSKAVSPDPAPAMAEVPSEDLAASDDIDLPLEDVPLEIPQKKRSSRLVKVALALLIPGGIAAAFLSGSLDETLKSPGVKATLQTVSDLAQPQLLKLADKFPALAKWVSPIPTLEDVTPEDYQALREAALQKISEGPKIAIATATSDAISPKFYVSSNLPDGTVIDFYVEGIPDTLLNKLSFHGKVSAILDHKLGKSGPLKSVDGKSVPRGEYVIYATENANQPEAVKTLLASVPAVTAKTATILPKGLKLLVSKPAFLGGNKDATYQSRLKEFHDKLKAKTTAEISEVKQFQATLESQLTQTTARYNQFRVMVKKGKLTPAARKGWDTFNAQWSKLEESIRQNYSKWTAQALEKDYYYGSLYTMTRTAGDAIDKLHRLHNDFFAGRTNAKSFEIQRGSAVSIADSVMSALKNKISQIESLAPTPNGMPRREGM